MTQGSAFEFHEARVVRLNTLISPVDPFELDGYQRLGVQPVLAEASCPEELIPLVEDSHAVLVVSTALPAEVIERMRVCRVICRLGVGVDKIDVGAATRLGIVVANVPGCFSAEMGEHTMALILALARKLPQMQQAVRDGAWRRSRALSVRNCRLSECTLGLVGFGDSARHLARLAAAFGMRVIATCRSWQAASPEAQQLGVELVDMATLLGRADYVSLHLPLTPETVHLIDARALQQMKPGACLINTARGAIVDEAALVHALESGRLGGAGLDTVESIDPFTVEEAAPRTRLLEFENVIITPHVAALSMQAMRAVITGGLQNLAAVLGGFWPERRCIVNPDVTPRVPLRWQDERMHSGE